MTVAAGEVRIRHSARRSQSTSKRRAAVCGSSIRFISTALQRAVASHRRALKAEALVPGMQPPVVKLEGGRSVTGSSG